MDKATLRQMLRERRQALATAELDVAGAEAARRLLGQACWTHARAVALHVAARGELPTAAVLAAAWAAGKRVALPRMDAAGRMELRLAGPGTPLNPGKHRIPEPPADAAPVEPGELDLVLAPGLAFDRQGRRLGQGGGDYDRLLAAVSPGCATVGWCHDFQLVDRVPTEPHDRRVALVITPSGAHAAAG